MGNCQCQAVDAAALVIQHPSGKLERIYSPLTASQVMKSHPGHYVSLIIPLPLHPDAASSNCDRVTNTAVRCTRVKLLRPDDTLALGRAYRLVTTQEVMKVVRAKKLAKMQRSLAESNRQIIDSPELSEANTRAWGAGRPKSWRPSLQSISESAS